MSYRPNDMCRRTFFPKLIQRHGFKVAVEVGVLYGEFAVCLLSELQTLYLVDSWEFQHKGRTREQQIDILKDNLREYTNWQIMCMNSCHAATFFQDGELDFVYIDASHKYEDVLLDIEVWLPKLQPNGVLAGHDYNLDGVRRAVGECNVNVLYGDKSESWWFYADSVTSRER